MALTDVADCQACTPGYNCDTAGLITLTATELCPAGKYCPSGTGSNSQAPESCDPGYYCPLGSSAQIECPVGTFNPFTDQAACQNCTAGRFCNSTGLTIDTDAPLCPAGYYCPANTQRPLPCPAGTLRETTGAASESDCDTCTAGKFCESAESAATGTGNCQDGFFCGGNSTSPDQNICPTGSFCQCTDGCTEAANCTAGNACPYTGMNQNELLTCNDGYYCDSGSTSQIPRTDETTYGPCLAGNYCISGLKSQCSAGTFFGGVGLYQSSDCQACTEGMYCDGVDSTQPTDFCDDGYLCSNSADNAQDQPCPAGYKCLNGTTIICGYGNYMSTQGVNTACTACDAGKTCDLDSTTVLTGLLTPSDDCPAGGYCETGNTQTKFTRCSPGTYNSNTGSSDSSACVACDAGKACPDYGTVTPSLNCAEGYYCNSGSSSQYPILTAAYDENAVNNGPCPPGYYCESGTDVPSKCPVGTYSTEYFGVTDADCVPCPAGYLCPNEGLGQLPDNSMLCPQGFYCPGNTSVAIDCLEGTYCPTGSDQPTNCPAGTYQPGQKKFDATTDCLPCEAKYFCPSGTGVLDTNFKCPDGYYCDGGIQEKFEKPCDRGFQCNNAAENLIACSPGTYTDITLQDACLTCEAGFYCPTRADGLTTEKLVCPLGSYCLSNVDTPTPCPAGYYGQNLGLRAASDCEPCPPGYYCDIPGETLASINSKLIDSGYYCQQGCDTATPLAATCTGDCVGDICPTGFKCPTGSSDPINCEDGEYQDQTGQSTCITCEPGFYCEIDTATQSNGSVKKNCPTGNYCEGATKPWTIIKCPIGTYRDTENGQTVADCADCDAGKYCTGLGISTPSGDCMGYLAII